MQQQSLLVNIVVILVVVFLMFQFIDKMRKLRGSHFQSKGLLPLCKTLTALLECSPEDARAETLKTMENSYFRSIWLTVYALDGEVWADSFAPTYGQLPMPSSELQKITFALIREQLAKDKKIELSHFGLCPITRRHDTVFIAAVQTENFIICLQTCGCETC
tara:strand:+ start:594 stop:1079 length:486 start_codon:yes stop_codon:yes gene_type:complete